MTEQWTDVLGRSYEYQPHRAEPIAEIEIVLGGQSALAVAEAAASLQRVPVSDMALLPSQRTAHSNAWRR